MYDTNRLHFPRVSVLHNRCADDVTACKEQSHATRLRFVTYSFFFTRCDVICDLLQDTLMENCKMCYNVFYKLTHAVVTVTSDHQIYKKKLASVLIFHNFI